MSNFTFKKRYKLPNIVLIKPLYHKVSHAWRETGTTVPVKKNPKRDHWCGGKGGGRGVGYCVTEM